MNPAERRFAERVILAASMSPVFDTGNVNEDVRLETDWQCEVITRLVRSRDGNDPAPWRRGIWV